MSDSQPKKYVVMYPNHPGYSGLDEYVRSVPCSSGIDDEPGEQKPQVETTGVLAKAFAMSREQATSVAEAFPLLDHAHGQAVVAIVVETVVMSSILDQIQ